MFQKLPLYLWYPSPSDVETIRHWLVTTPLYCHHNMLAMVIINGLNWGVETNTTVSNTVIIHNTYMFMLEKLFTKIQYFILVYVHVPVLKHYTVTL